LSGRPRRRPVDENRIEHPGYVVLRCSFDRDLGSFTALAVEGAEIDQQRLRTGDEGSDLLG